MSGRLPGGPAANDEAAFRSNVREAVTTWQRRLAASGAVERAGASIGVEAAELRKIAASPGWWQIPQHLTNVAHPPPPPTPPHPYPAPAPPTPPSPPTPPLR